MSAPQQVQRQAEEAARRQQELSNEPKSPAETPVVAAEPAPAPANPPADDMAELRKKLDASEHRYRTLQGMYEADRNRSRDQIDLLTQKIEDLVAKATPAKEAPAPEPAHTSKDVEEFGQETIDFVTRVSRVTAREVAREVAREIVEQALAQRLTPVANTVNEVATRVQKTAAEEYYEALAEKVPDWQEINIAAPFLQWLTQPDPYSGIPLQTLLSDAHQKADAGRVIAIFNRYKAEAGLAVTPPQGGGEKPPRAPVDERAAAVEPNRSSAGARPAGKPQGRTWTRAQIQQFYRDVTAGRITGPEATALEQDILKAPSEGRLVG